MPKIPPQNASGKAPWRRWWWAEVERSGVMPSMLVLGIMIPVLAVTIQIPEPDAAAEP